VIIVLKLHLATASAEKSEPVFGTILQIHRRVHPCEMRPAQKAIVTSQWIALT